MNEVITIDVLQAIKERRSTFSFQPEEVDLSILKEIFTYGTWAPTHYMKESWNIKLYQRNGKKAFVDTIISSYQRIGMLKTDNDSKTLKMIDSMKQFLLEIPHHALIYFEKDPDPIRYEEEYSSVCAFIQNIQLAAWSYGVGMLWTITPYMHDPGFVQEIGLDGEKVKIAAVMQIGYPKQISRNKGRTAIEEKLEIITE
ncbi:nitroreductase [Virgibacillus dakarensis]|uniref:Nitroreductase n=1 Tax=Lentibacillus populi TaxID=1827502 RepID=A0A9W5TVM0_9BACI|nr:MULTISPECIES: nitroreductase [Bacillaceae]MBT2217890.1 nitroreductase [Virgibacillus dakarensis]MTW87570.1 nitroreductase [Virgibacillus dakarensis]GGB35950.1 nitroreductase [Lentibacillus populi]